MIIPNFGIRSGFFSPSRPQYAILETGILCQIDSFERLLRGEAQNAPRPAVSVPHLAGIGYVS